MKIELKRIHEINPEQLAYYANDMRVSQYLRNSFPYPYTLDNALSFIQFSLDHHNEDFGIVVDGICIGCIGATFFRDIYQKNCEIGYWIGYDYWNKGIMSQVVPAMIDYIFHNYDIAKIHAEVYAENKASCRLLEKCGFQKEGYLRKHLYKNHKFHDAVVYAYIRKEDEND